MGWGFRKSIDVAPGIRINLSKSGVSTSIGAKGFAYNTRGRLTASVPSTGIRLTQNLKAARAARHVGPVVPVSGRRGAYVTANLSKRELEAHEFAQQVRARMWTALVDYFFSHGVHVHDDDLDKAVTLADHQAFLASLSDELEATTSAIQLATDVRSISLAEKERAMRALYEIERQCAGHQGDLAGLKQAASRLLSAVRNWPSRPGLVIPLLVALCGACLAYLSNAGAGMVLTALMLAYGWSGVRGYRRKCAGALAAIETANQQFDALLVAEVTPRPERPSSKDFVVPQAAACAAVAVVAALAAVAAQLPHPAGAEAVDTGGRPTATVATAAPAVQAHAVEPGHAKGASKPAHADTRSFAPSFNCRKARSDAEHLVCGDAELAAADVELAALHAKAKAAVLDKRAFRKRTEAQWIVREETCHDRECVARWYAEQKLALAEIARTGSLGEDMQQALGERTTAVPPPNQ